MPFSKQLNKILQGKTWRFFGGIKPHGRKSTADSAIEELAIPSLITLPLDRHLGPDGQLLVRVGDYVKAGQPLTIPGGKRNVPLHASTSGDITAINMQVLPHPSGFTGRCITIKPDGLDAKVPDQPMPNWQDKTPHEILERIRAFGVEGLGGAQFQTAAKIGAAIEESAGDCNIFIVNGAECEPVATCDDRLMQERAEDIAQGIEVVRHILKPKAIIVAIEDNKPRALDAMKKAVAKDVIVRAIPSVYPSGAARNLIKICTGIEIPYSEHTSECGIVVDNVETVFAIKQAVIDGIPLIKRVITVDGQTLGKSGNALVRLGTSVRFVLNSYKLNPERRQRVILGGPFMGFTLPTIDVPITKSATCVFVPSYKELDERPKAMNCIRCGRCARVCPSRLVPYQLYALSRANQHKKTKSCGMMDCTECGCCSYVCPSRIALTGQFRKEKAILRLLDENQRRNIRTQERIAARNERLKKEEEQRIKRREAALKRAALQKADNASLSPDELSEKRKAMLEAARERAAAKRAAALAKGANAVNGEITGIKAEANPSDNMLDESAAEVKAVANEQNEEKKAENLPANLRKDSGIKHAPVIPHWDEVKEHEQDLTPVENRPSDGVVIPTSKPRSKTYLIAPDEKKHDHFALPVSLRRKDLLEQTEAKSDSLTKISTSVDHKIEDVLNIANIDNTAAAKNVAQSETTIEISVAAQQDATREVANANEDNSSKIGTKGQNKATSDLELATKADHPEYSDDSDANKTMEQDNDSSKELASEGSKQAKASSEELNQDAQASVDGRSKSDIQDKTEASLELTKADSKEDRSKPKSLAKRKVAVSSPASFEVKQKTQQAVSPFVDNYKSSFKGQEVDFKNLRKKRKDNDDDDAGIFAPH